MRHGLLHTTQKVSQSMQWKYSGPQDQKKTCMSESKFKALLIVFFDINGIVMIERVPSSQTVNQLYQIEVVKRLKEKRLQMWSDGGLLHQDNEPAHTALSIKQFLTNKNITVIRYFPYSPDLVPSDLFTYYS
ncbi:HTH_48 domain-containing protein [Trichonephila clavipes]|nr:HTH_48 domain-containing protein [Trichonephila clavipes]